MNATVRCVSCITVRCPSGNVSLRFHECAEKVNTGVLGFSEIQLCVQTNKKSGPPQNLGPRFLLAMLGGYLLPVLVLSRKLGYTCFHRCSYSAQQWLLVPGRSISEVTSRGLSEARS